ncbi:MAG: S-layer homology domain-containing protein [Candidatus Ornithomonoglobus sp.]
METSFLKRIDTSVCGKGCRMWLGDIDGDGRMEIVMVQPDGGFDDRFYSHSVQCATAFDLEGEKLWQIGTPDPRVDGSGSDIPAQIYDIDNDGKNEFLCCMGGELCIFSGKTGLLKHKHKLPDERAHDCIVIADLEGTGHAQNIILKDRYRKLWALDKDFKVMWTFEGNIGHYPWPYDLDGDGREELIAGYNVLDGDGRLLWKIDMEDHADCIWVCDLDQDRNTPPAVLVGGSDTTAYTPDGRLIWRFTDTVESQNIAPGNFIPENKGTEIGGLDRIVRRGPSGRDGVFLIDYKAQQLFKEDRSVPGWSSIVTTMHNFDGTGRDHLLVYRRDGMPNGIFDGNMNMVMEFPFEGHVMWADLIGDGQPQVLVYDDEKIEIYSCSKVDLSRPVVPYTRPQPKRLYNWTRYWGSEMAPDQYALNYITGDFTANEIGGWAERCAAGGTEDAENAISRADFMVLLVRALDLHAYGENIFSDVLKTDYFCSALQIAARLGIISGRTFRPKEPITAKEAEAILKKVGKPMNIDSDGRLTKRDAAEIIKGIIK